MPYASNGQLPERIRQTLPTHAQNIFRAAFNRAYDSAPRRIAVLGALLSIALVACRSPEPPLSPTPPARTSTAPASPASTAKDPAAAQKLIASGAVVIDVRTTDEYAQAHLPHAVNIPVQEFSVRLNDVAMLVANDKTRPIVVYCAAGARAAKAKAQLAAAGYTHVVNGGGLHDLAE